VLKSGALKRALVAGVLAVTALPAGALASSFRQLAPSTVAFASDGARYAAWQVVRGSPVVVLDTHSAKQSSYEETGCSLVSEEGAFGPPAAAGHFLLGCGEASALLDATTGVATPLPKPAGQLDGEWREIGARYVEGNADPADCSASSKELHEEDACLALYDIATGALSYRRQSQAPDLDRAGAPPVCNALRGRLLAERNNSAIGEFAYSQGLLVTLGSDGKKVRLSRCRGQSKDLASRRKAENLDLAGGLLTWDTARAGNSAPVGTEERVIDHGALWSYEAATGRRREWQLPRETTRFYSHRVRAVLGRSAHAGKTLFWIAAATVNGSPSPSVETSAVYVAQMP
jgi:hypothetical protein